MILISKKEVHYKNNTQISHEGPTVLLTGPEYSFHLPASLTEIPPFQFQSFKIRCYGIKQCLLNKNSHPGGNDLMMH